VAKDSVVMAMPPCVYLTSGSLPRLPTRITLLIPLANFLLQVFGDCGASTSPALAVALRDNDPIVAHLELAQRTVRSCSDALSTASARQFRSLHNLFGRCTPSKASTRFHPFGCGRQSSPLASYSDVRAPCCLLISVIQLKSEA